jgi:hypothetical protein
MGLSSLKLLHGLITLLSHTQLPHNRECHQSAEATVTHQPKA